jgi:hypothetical protein
VPLDDAVGDDPTPLWEPGVRTPLEKPELGRKVMLAIALLNR